MTVLPIDYPFPSQISPFAAFLDEQSLAWAKQFGIVSTERDARRLLITQPGILIARAYPRASRVALQLMTDWITWGFLWDDQFDETGVGRTPDSLEPVLDRLSRILSGAPGESGDGAAEQALISLRTRILAERPDDPDWVERFSRTASRDFKGFLWEARNRAKRVIPTMAEYHEMRMHTSGANTCIVFSELMNGLHLPEEVREHTVVKQLAFLTNTILSWCNDLFSLAKELEQGDVHNIVLVIQHERQCSLADAKNYALLDHDKYLADFLQLKKELPSFNPRVDAELKCHIDSMGSLIRAQLDWSLAVQRYKPAPPA